MCRQWREIGCFGKELCSKLELWGTLESCWRHSPPSAGIQPGCLKIETLNTSSGMWFCYSFSEWKSSKSIFRMFCNENSRSWRVLLTRVLLTMLMNSFSQPVFSKARAWKLHRCCSAREGISWVPKAAAYVLLLISESRQESRRCTACHECGVWVTYRHL